MTIRKTPTIEATAMAGENNAAMVPSRAVRANVRAPRSLLPLSFDSDEQSYAKRCGKLCRDFRGWKPVHGSDRFKQKVYTAVESGRG
jgi:hypothetical protein